MLVARERGRGEVDRSCWQVPPRPALEPHRPGGWPDQAGDAAAVVDLPDPDSPTRPSASPAETEKLTSSTAWRDWPA